jgi:hypothetical protein
VVGNRLMESTRDRIARKENLLDVVVGVALFQAAEHAGMDLAGAKELLAAQLVQDAPGADRSLQKAQVRMERPSSAT